MKKNRLLILLIGASVVLLLGLFSYFSMPKQKVVPSKQLKVVTTLFPLFDLARSLGGPESDVSLLLPPGTEAHSFEPKPSDIIKIQEADIFVYTGDFMEPWVSDILSSVSNPRLIVVNASKGINLTSSDPHIWLDFVNLEQMLNNVSEAFLQIDHNSSAVKVRTTTYLADLQKLDLAYQQGLSDCESHQIFYGGHYAFAYLAKHYNLDYVAAQGLSPDAEPSAQDLVSLVEQINNSRVKFVFYEELSSPKISEVISRETNSQLLLLNAAHNVSRDDLRQGVTFKEIMLNNLANLRVGLNCK